MSGRQYSERERAAVQLIFRLEELYPKTFFMLEERRRPIKQGIHLDILAEHPDIGDRRDLGLAMQFYVCNHRYQKRLAQGDDRIDLAGNPCGPATSEQRAGAWKWLTGYYAKRKAKRATAPSQAPAPLPDRKSTFDSPPPPPPGPKRISLADLRAAAAARKGAAA
jgi:sRNA-binding protein